MQPLVSSCANRASKEYFESLIGGSNVGSMCDVTNPYLFLYIYRLYFDIFAEPRGGGSPVRCISMTIYSQYVIQDEMRRSRVGTSSQLCSYNW